MRSQTMRPGFTGLCSNVTSAPDVVVAAVARTGQHVLHLDRRRPLESLVDCRHLCNFG
jgi:hypothetical protein